ncbi:MAG: carboxypeptidase [Candidatus Thermofonsia Clade 1 bacterium]|uniref:Carboxypeptidase n=1 Tax=Candidatus Thermofonsia Clade 1 bacterium TaxID=2364210 RepID=A0A2M8P153_9CHLR|nr:MAG: carboxypeptidase [Candidatus Thermofonsia Clade 1 bacterium]
MSVQTQHALVDFYQARLNDIVGLISTLANFETPTSEKQAVDALGAFLRQKLEALGAQITVFPRQAVGDIFLAKWNAQASGKPIVFLMHLDTVWQLGTLTARPVHIAGDRLIGPGTWDMKASIGVVLSAIEGLQARGEFPNRPIWALFTTDEETGSLHSWEIIEEVARQAGLCLVMEFAATNGGVKTWRKGIATYQVSVTGKASHAGNAPEKGINAVVELAHQTLRITALNRLDLGTSVSVTVVQGGTASNVIPERATAQVDVRFKTQAEAERVHQALMSLTPVLEGAKIEVIQRAQRPPMERDATMIQSYEQLRAIGAELGIDLPEEGSGGGSDGNITAALGIPTLDGLGPLGEGAHAAHEQVVISSIPARVALMDALMRQWRFAEQ